MLYPIAWYCPSPAAGMQPCKWAGWINGKYYVVSLMSA